MSLLDAGQTPNPFEGTIDMDPADALMQRVTMHCLSAACLDRQEQLAHDMEMWVGPGNRISYDKGASLILQRMGCPKLAALQAESL
jgi:hypothetical protein